MDAMKPHLPPSLPPASRACAPCACTMPRGFLVKRTRRACGSYRMPSEDNGSALPIDSAAPASSAIIEGVPGHEEPREEPAQHDARAGGGMEKVAAWHSLPFSPVPPGGLEVKKTLYKRYISPPASSMERLLCQHPFTSPELHATPCPRPNKVPAKRHKASRKLHFTDEVTTSPVLGLRIKAEEPEVPPLAKRPPLGEFICQLCKEQYPDPFALAQHKCSRIVRVEYRCPECDKIFSCPANLASHRRWHKPRAGLASEVVKKGPMPVEGKENSNGRNAGLSLEPGVQHQHGVDSSPITHANSSFHSREDKQPGGGGGSEEEEAYHCPYCHKRFRRHAYLRKHLLTHQPYSPMDRGQLTYPCALCGVHFPSMDIRDKHRLWHAVREELLLPLEEALVAEGGQQIFPCELCPTAFFSSPGLTLHMSKCHSAESRQELPAQIPLRPGC